MGCNPTGDCTTGYAGGRAVVASVGSSPHCLSRVTSTTFGQRFGRTKLNRMKHQWLALSRRYRVALRRYLQSRGSLLASSARQLGRQAATLGVERQKLNWINRSALTALRRPGASTSARDELNTRARVVYSEVIRSWKEPGSYETKLDARINRLDVPPTQRTRKLIATNLRLQRGVIQHKTSEQALKKSGKHYAKLLRKAEQRQTDLQELTHRLLSAQENERRWISHELQDEIAQTLLGINVRLLTLKKLAHGDTTMLRKEMASTQRVVEQSVKTISRFAREIDFRHFA